MKRDDIALGHAAADVALGSPLSDGEAELLAGDDAVFDAESPEGIATLLYCHLDQARRLRLKLDAARHWDSAYHHAFRERELAITAATRHYHRLRELGYAFDSHLARLILSEGLKP